MWRQTLAYVTVSILSMINSVKFDYNFFLCAVRSGHPSNLHIWFSYNQLKNLQKLNYC